MRSLSDNYASSHSGNHETIADLVFCALVVLVLFVLALILEVHQRVRVDAASQVIPTEVVERAESLSPEQIKELSRKLQQQQVELRQLQAELRESSQTVKSQLASLAGEQRFTGAREPAAFTMAYDYRSKLYFFAPSKEVDHADRRQSGESQLDYMQRKTRELVAVAEQLSAARGFSLTEVQALYSGLTTYNEVVSKGGEFLFKQSKMGLYYHTLLSAYVSGDSLNSMPDDSDAIVTAAIGEMGVKTGTEGDQIYPRWLCKVDDSAKQVDINGVSLTAKEFLGVLLSVSGRGVILDFQGYAGTAPTWLQEGALMPAGYISKMPKLPLAAGH